MYEIFKAIYDWKPWEIVLLLLFLDCEKCDDLVIDECPKHPYIRDATNDGAEASMPTKSRRDAAKLRRTLIETAKGINDPQIVSFSSVGDAGAQDNFEDTEAMLKDEDQHDEDDQQSDEDEMANNLESSNVRVSNKCLRSKILR